MTLSIEEREALTRHIARLPEIEFVELLREMATIIKQNKWEHIIDDCFEIESYETEFDEEREEHEKTKEELREAKETLNEIRDLL